MEIQVNDDKSIEIQATGKELGDLHREYGRHRAFADIFYNMTQYFERKQSKTDKDKPRSERQTGYHFIPLRLNQVVERLAYVKVFLQHLGTDTRFLDAGCGPGNVLLTAKAMDVSCYSTYPRYHGIELDKKGAEIARILTGASPPTRKHSNRQRQRSYIYNTDILTFSHYKNYNVIYYYCPIKIHPLQALFEERLEDTVKVGTLLLPNLKQSSVVNGLDKRFRTIRCMQQGTIKNGGGIYMWAFYQKIANGKRKATALRPMDIEYIPPKYHDMFHDHIKGLKRGSRAQRKF